MTPVQETLQTILLVEDKAEIRRFVRHTLDEGGFEVLVAADAASAVQIEGQFPRAIHLLLSDVTMPGISGPELAKKLKQLRPEMRVDAHVRLQRRLCLSSITDAASSKSPSCRRA